LIDEILSKVAYDSGGWQMYIYSVIPNLYHLSHSLRNSVDCFAHSTCDFISTRPGYDALLLGPVDGPLHHRGCPLSTNTCLARCPGPLLCRMFPTILIPFVHRTMLTNVCEQCPCDSAAIAAVGCIYANLTCHCVHSAEITQLVCLACKQSRTALARSFKSMC
jgi:hypothetical protein